ncbi:MAG: cytochrome ubiquinol oxidase subunit I [candidate division Zixibacteria bacterium]|nr:cytochrome ubiquinol oxidase subunit I [candidate division Zixibacteria bacterium]
MDALTLSRWQFGLTIGFHYLFPVLSIGLGLILVIMEGLYLKTRCELYHQMTRFWVKIFGLIFALGVATGIVMEFQFGTNWSNYSRYVGDVFGSALAAEGIFAFFLESGFLAILLFGWNKVSKGMHFFATLMVALGAHFSAIWIVVANSWQQTPAGHHIVAHGDGFRAEITDFWGMVFNPSFVDRIWHVYMGCWQAGAFFVLSVSAWYLLKKRHTDFAVVSVKIALVVAVIASMLQLVSGHQSAVGVAQNQPAKMAAFEGHFEASAPADMWLFGLVDEENQKVNLGIKLPGMLSYLIHGDATAPVTGLDQFPEDERPPVNLVFQSYHAMVAIGMLLILISWLGLYYWIRRSLWDKRWYLFVLVFSVFLPQAANQLGWFSAEVGRQPWVVYGLLKTADGLSPTVKAGEVMTSIIFFGLIYLLLFILFIYLLNEKIQHGPEDDVVVERQRA